MVRLTQQRFSTNTNPPECRQGGHRSQEMSTFLRKSNENSTNRKHYAQDHLQIPTIEANRGIFV
ncbi:MAG: hypothetical protein H7829_08875 [Magnetococcus sp. THC-1_WYH]